jgi:hypothetical protein
MILRSIIWFDVRFFQLRGPMSFEGTPLLRLSENEYTGTYRASATSAGVLSGGIKQELSSSENASSCGKRGTEASSEGTASRGKGLQRLWENLPQMALRAHALLLWPRRFLLPMLWLSKEGLIMRKSYMGNRY